MKKSNKGFTLVELLAVLVVLIVIILIAVNVINNRVKEAKKNAVEVNANNYIKAINGLAALSQNVGEDMESGYYEVRDLNKADIKISGDKPRRGYLSIENYEVLYGCLTYKDYSAKIMNGKTVEIVKSCNNVFVVAKFDYTGSIASFTADKSGIYKFDLWGAQGGDGYFYGDGGNGGYTTINVKLDKNQIIYVVVGGAGNSVSTADQQIHQGGYNGGGYSRADAATVWGSGGGATHIALTSGLLKDLNKNDILAVAGGGGGGGYLYSYNNGGSGGGFKGSDGQGTGPGTGATQNQGGLPGYAPFGLAGSYGQGGSATDGDGGGGGGGGLYGGGGGYDAGSASGGGSGYMNFQNPLVTSGYMYCYHCTESSEKNTKTSSTSCYNATPTENCSKESNGYVKVSYLGGV